ncbi:MAG: hypothetical protein J6K72_11150 [Clostridia bacterium]|nr:hypothetical protein [Clostridia bacterium]
MRKFLRTFAALNRSIHWSDLAILVLGPFFGVLIRYALPIAQKLLPLMPDLRQYTKPLDSVLMLVSAFSILYPFVLCSVEERVNGIALSLTISPLRSSGYFICRFVLPCILAGVYALCMELLFSPVDRPFWHTALCCLLSGPTALSGMLVAPVFTKDKLSGLTLIKLSVWLLLAAPALIGFALPTIFQPLFLIFPSYWFMRCTRMADWLLFVMCFFLSLFWIVTGYRLWSRSLKELRLTDSWE